MVKSRILSKLRQHKLVLGAAISRVPQPWLIEVIGSIGYDFIWLDMEHRSFGYDVIEPISLACRKTGMDLMVRILKTGYSSPMRTLEFGANSIMVPHCCSVAEAKEWVDWTKFPPLGKRGFDGAGADADYGLADSLEHLKHANEETALVLQIEDAKAVECVEAIISVPGVDLLLPGPADLSISYGIPFQFDHPTMQKALDRIAAAAAKAGKWWGAITGTPEAAQTALHRGAGFLLCAFDHSCLVDGFANTYRDFEGFSRR